MLRRRVRRGVDHLGAGVLVLAGTGEGHRQRLAGGALAEQVAGGVLHGDLGADVAVDPLHPAALVHGGPLGHQVVDVVGPVLDGRVADVGVLLHDDLDDRGVQRVAAVDRRGAALDVVHRRALVGDDQRPLELAHVLGVDAEVGLQRDVDLHALGHVDERAAGPDRGVERGELVVADRDDRAEVLLEELLVLAQARCRCRRRSRRPAPGPRGSGGRRPRTRTAPRRRRSGAASPPPGCRACRRCS